jgi:hypothetical protein
MRPSKDSAVGLGVEASGTSFCTGVVENSGDAKGIEGYFVGVLEDWLRDFRMEGEGGRDGRGEEEKRQRGG